MKNIFTPLFLCISFIAFSQTITNTNELPKIENFAFQINYLEVAPNLKMAYIDEGNKANPVVLLLHGEPSWSYTFRTIIPTLVDNGFRVIAPDLIGFGFSDKFQNAANYTYTNQTNWLQTFINQMHLTNIHLFGHDWGGMIGLRIIAKQPSLFSAVIISYAYLFTGEEPIPESFYGWVDFAKNNPDFQPGVVINWGTNTQLSATTVAAFNAPYPSEASKTALRIYPSLIPTDKNNEESKINKALWKDLKNFNKPFLTVWGNHNDAMWVGKDTILQQEIRGAKGLNHQILTSNHFITEDQPKVLATIMVDFFKQYGTTN